MSQPEVCESVLVPLVNQFSMMQQQMFDQFQQAMGMLVQMFGTMHREQMEVIREELDRLHQLSKELQELKDELAKPSRQPVTTIGRARRRSLPSRPAALTDNGSSTGTSSNHRTGISDSHHARDWPYAPPLDPAGGPASRPIPARARLPGPARSPGIRQPDRDAVAWIHQRIMTIQSERETRWQKILKLLPGVS